MKGTGFSRRLPTILTIIGGIGFAITVVSAIRQTPKALEKIDKAEEEKGEELTTLEKVQVTAPIYIPTMLIGASTLACMFGANVLSMKQQASLASAYALIDRYHKDYKSKVKELYGEEVHNNVVDAIVKDHCEDVVITAQGFLFNSTLEFDGVSEPEVVRTFYEPFSKRYFESTMSKIVQAEYHLNRNYMFEGSITLNEFYEFLGLEKIDYGDILGWSCYSGDVLWIDFNHRVTRLDDGMEICVIEMVFEPTEEYDQD